MAATDEKARRVTLLETAAGRWMENHFLPSLLALAFVQSLIAIMLASSRFAYGDVERSNVFHDVLIYYEYASRIFGGGIPYRDFVVEYPILALPLFLIPRCLTSYSQFYVVFWCFQILAFNAIGLWLVARWSAAYQGMDRVPRCLAWYTLFFLLSNPIALARFDLAAMVCAFGAAFYLMGSRPVLGGCLASMAALMKLIPGVAAAPIFLRDVAHPRISGLRGLLTSALVFAVGMGSWFVLGRGGIRATFQYHAERGLEIGSLYTGILALASKIQGITLAISFDHWALHIDSPIGSRLASLSVFMQLGAVFLALGVYWKTGMREPLRCSAACLVACIVFGKVLSPQFLIWLIPFMACLEGRSGTRARWFYALCCVLTYLIYPRFFNQVIGMTGRGILLLNARNLMLLILFGLLVFDGERTTDDAITPRS